MTSNLTPFCSKVEPLSHSIAKDHSQRRLGRSLETWADVDGGLVCVCLDGSATCRPRLLHPRSSSQRDGSLCVHIWSHGAAETPAWGPKHNRGSHLKPAF